MQNPLCTILNKIKCSTPANKCTKEKDGCPWLKIVPITFPELKNYSFCTNGQDRGKERMAEAQVSMTQRDGVSYLFGDKLIVSNFKYKSEIRKKYQDGMGNSFLWG